MNLIAAYHVLYGEYHGDDDDHGGADDFDEYDDVRDSLEDRTAGLQAYITQHITTIDYTSKYELIPIIVPSLVLRKGYIW